jgi:hypothetical protein
VEVRGQKIDSETKFRFPGSTRLNIIGIRV